MKSTQLVNNVSVHILMSLLKTGRSRNVVSLIIGCLPKLPPLKFGFWVSNFDHLIKNEAKMSFSCQRVENDKMESQHTRFVNNDTDIVQTLTVCIT